MRKRVLPEALQNRRRGFCRTEEVEADLFANQGCQSSNASFAFVQRQCCKTEEQHLQNCGMGSVSLESLLETVSYEGLLKESVSACAPLQEVGGAA